VATARLTRLELWILEALWADGPLSVRQIQEAFSGNGIPGYTTLQTAVVRLEAKGAVKLRKKIGNAHIYEAAISRSDARQGIVTDLLALFDGGVQPVMTHLIETGKLTLEDLQRAEKKVREMKDKG
jgi:BlaI family transcriptional regulator, penicillinase repressor